MDEDDDTEYALVIADAPPAPWTFADVLILTANLVAEMNHAVGNFWEGVADYAADDRAYRLERRRFRADIAQTIETITKES